MPKFVWKSVLLKRTVYGTTLTEQIINTDMNNTVMNNIRMPKEMLNCRPNGRRQLGRPLKRLLDEAETGLSKPNLWWKIADGLARGGSALRFFGPEPALGVSKRDLQKTLGRWLVNQHGVIWRGLGDTQRQAREFISGPSLGTRAKFMNLVGSNPGLNWPSYGT